MNKREFFKKSMLLAGGTMLNVSPENDLFMKLRRRGNRKNKNGLVFRFKPYTLQLIHTFTLATSTRTSTPGVLTEFEYEGFTGYGEASMPPYLGESQESVIKFLSLLDFSGFSDPFLVEDILEYSGSLLPGNFAAKASVDIALHDLVGKLLGQPLYRLYGLNPEKAPLTSFTIGLDTPEIVREKVKEADPYRILKVKLGRENDREMINIIRSLTDKPICVDANQGWKDRGYALEMSEWLKEQGVIFLEQPMPKEQKYDIAWLTQRSPLPVIGDEAIQNVNDIVEQRDVYSGINIKLMKCGGLSAAMRMINVASALGLKVMIGCMTETSCAVSAAAQLSPLTDWCDLDGNLLISNDPFDGLKIIDGRITLPDRPGIGVVSKK